MATTGQQGVPQVEQTELPPLAELVTDEDVAAAALAYGAHYNDSRTDALRAALEAYGARLLGRIGQAGP